jgi:[citrate (pro-3S)-lyase] ligase
MEPSSIQFIKLVIQPMSFKKIDCILPEEIEQVKQLLLQNNLIYEKYVDHTIAFLDNQKIIATGSIYQNVIKMIAIHKDYQGKNLTSLLLSRLIDILNNKKIDKYFIFTTPINKKYFLDYHFSIVCETNEIVLLENKPFLITNKLLDIKQNLPKLEGSVACIVLNCNPITNGHLYLIETAAKENDHLILFLVETDLSLFPFQIRFKLVKEACKHLSNVYLCPSTNYIISRATFPSYFKKEINNLSQAHMNLDAQIFKTHFMPIFNIKTRYVGSEPNDETTNLYNQTLKETLGPKLKIIKRLEINQQIISASYVRKLMNNRDFDTIEKLVPKSTLSFLKTKEGGALFNESCTTQSEGKAK